MSLDHLTTRPLGHSVTIIGAGLAGCEAAFQCARRGVAVELWEQRPGVSTEAHRTADFAELVCSNSLKSLEPTNAHGLLKAELELLGSELLRIARENAIPGGKALVIDRAQFGRAVTERITALPGITIRREQATQIPDSGIAVIATGPLTSAPLSDRLADFLGTGSLAFYDTISPIVSRNSLIRDRYFAANRYIPGDDYLNCPLTESEYDAFYEALLTADLYTGHEPNFQHSLLTIPPFEGCMPIEDIARRGKKSLLFGPMKPVGLIDPQTGRQPFAVLQLRRENREGTMYNLVGFQTRMRQPEQRRVLGLIPALASAEFLRYGSVHRNTFINAPLCLKATLQVQKRDSLFIAGQLSGVEGYVESIATGLLAGINAARLIAGQPLLVLPETTILGGLLRYITTPTKSFQPMNANFGLLPTPKAKHQNRPRIYCERSLAAVRELLSKDCPLPQSDGSDWSDRSDLDPAGNSRAVPSEDFT
jgi:methylenetetrahydrofolate--tRNA-(uracil-5-)-methyltransferase